jgi:nucleotide-binding universal stress UspA family protein
MCGEARSVRQGLHDLARTRQADVLVIGASRQDGLDRDLVGGDTRELLEDAPCAIAVAPVGYSDRRAALGIIGVAYDGSAESARALVVGRRLAADHHARLSAFHAVRTPLYAHHPWNVEGGVEKQVEEARERIEALGGVEAHAAQGDAGEALARYAQSVDLLVVGSHRYRPIARLLEQSTAQRLADEASSPLLVLSDSAPTPQPARETARGDAQRRAASAGELIIVGVDGHPEGRDATVLAATLGRATGAELLLVTVDVDPRRVVPPARAADGASARETTGAMLRELCETVVPGARAVVEPDWSVPHALARLVSLERPALVVVGSNRRAPHGHVRIGGRTRQLLSQAQCAVAIAPRGLSVHARQDLSVIGVGYDGGPQAAAALKRAAVLAHAAGATLRIRGVIEDHPPGVGRLSEQHSYPERLRGEIVAPELERLHTELERATSAMDVEVAVDVTPGSPAEALLDLSGRVDLLVIGSRWGDAAPRPLLETTSEALLHDARCSVMLVPRPLLAPAD